MPSDRHGCSLMTKCFPALPRRRNCFKLVLYMYAKKIKKIINQVFRLPLITNLQCRMCITNLQHSAAVYLTIENYSNS